MKKTTRTRTLAIALVALSLTAAGCNKPPKWKDDVTNALQQQAGVKQYVFHGSADLNVGLPAPAAGSNEATASLVSMFSKSRIQWSGMSSSDPLRLEADYTLTPGGSSASFTLPVLFKDNLIYMSIPLLNKSGEYFSFDPSKNGGTAAGAASLKNVNSALSDSVKQLIAEFDPKWFKKDKKLSDESGVEVIRLPITDKTKDAITEKVKAALPAVIDGWKTNGILTAAQAEQFKKGAAGSWSATGGELVFHLTSDGYINQEHVSLTYRDGSGADRQIQYSQAFEGINQPPAFKKDTPKSVRPFEDVLKLLQSGKNDK
ncbi:hypothetical protein [Gorillibacterium sp. sgz500922]|uniref:hypothetical protein n=1 Tax=Gorillibacterium sp. sgz500922 TaxID=3446694 RepID=UPI003F677F96